MKTKNKMKIPHSEYWGTYNGKDIYKYYGPSAKAFSETEYKNIVFAKDGLLWLSGYRIGEVSDNGYVSNWCPQVVEAHKDAEKRQREATKAKAVKETKGEPVVDTSKLVDEVLERAMNRSIEDLLGVKEKA